MLNLEDFQEYFLQSILADTESRGLLKSQSFFENVCEDLLTVGDLSNNYTYAEFYKTGIEAYGYDYEGERELLTVVNYQFHQVNELITLKSLDAETKFNRSKKFIEKCFNGLYLDLEETSDAYSMAYKIFQLKEKNQISSIRILLLTDGLLSRSAKEYTPESLDDIVIYKRIIDLEYLFKIYQSGQDISEFEVEVDIPFLKVNSDSSDYESYLSVVNGNTLVGIFENFGQKLFEQNVRTFLQFRGAVNKGLRNTIEYHPEMFFAYNNGITATASGVEIIDDKIVKIKNFQIVNGGQTTSAIYAAFKNFKKDVSNVNVQMKLSVVETGKNLDNFVSKVAQYANTQNKINNSDFFSNSPFHKEMKDYSLRTYAPAVGMSQIRTKWFYERVRGEYLNSMAYLTNSEKNKFLIENPKKQLLDKKFLAKAVNSWRQLPHLVSKGAEDNFKKFAEYINELIEKDELSINEKFFKESIAKILLFRGVEKLVSDASWYDGGFRAQTVTYTIAYLAALCEFSNLKLNFNRIWEEQKLPSSLISLLEIIAHEVYECILNPPPGNANIAQWTKQESCWKSVKNLPIEFPEIDSSLFVEFHDELDQIKEAKKTKNLDTDLEKQIFVIQYPNKNWKLMYDYFKDFKASKNLTATKLDILKKYAGGMIKSPSEKQSRILYDIYLTAKEESLIIE